MRRLGKIFMGEVPAILDIKKVLACAGTEKPRASFRRQRANTDTHGRWIEEAERRVHRVVRRPDSWWVACRGRLDLNMRILDTGPRTKPLRDRMRVDDVGTFDAKVGKEV